MGVINERFEPWGGSPTGRSNPAVAPFDLAAKDPVISRPDAWDFSNGRALTIDWLGCVHRGTPWQTFYLKSAPVDPAGWWRWTGVASPSEAIALRPTNDWRIASTLALLFNTKDPHALISVNQPDVAAWAAALDGMTAVTNLGQGQFETVLMSSNSTQVATIANGRSARKRGQTGGMFRNVGDAFATPELSIVSPWLHTATNGITDAVLESIPSQLLATSRPDPIGTIKTLAGGIEVQFSGFDGYPYAVEVSSDLSNWSSVSTNYPSQGVLSILKPKAEGVGGRFDRSRLLQ